MLLPVQTAPERLHVRSDKRRKYPFELLEVGDMFFVPNKSKNTMMSFVWATGRRLGRKFCTRHIYMRQVNGKWVQCSAHDPGANLGVCVYREK